MSMATRDSDPRCGAGWPTISRGTSPAHIAAWCFALTRTEPGSRRPSGLSYLLVPMRQPGVTVRPIRQLTGTSEFNEVFFDDAGTDADLVVGRVGQGWRVAMATLG